MRPPIAALACALGALLALSSPSLGRHALGAAQRVTHALSCKTVVKTVHGHKKKVRVCAKAAPLFSHPSDLVVDARGNVLVADGGSKSVITLSPAGKVLARWKSAGSAQFGVLYGIALDPAGNTYLSDAAVRVLDKLDSSGRTLAQWSTDLAEPSSFPTLLAVTPNGDIYLSDHSAEAVLHLSSSGALLGKIGGGELGDPYGVAAAPDGNVYVADYGAARVREYAPDGTAIATWGDGPSGSVRLRKPEAIALDAHGNIVVSEAGGEIVTFDRAGTMLKDWTATVARPLKDPSGIAFDGSGNLYVAEYMGNIVQKLAPDGTVLATWK